MLLPDSAILNNLSIPGIRLPDHSFEKTYLTCRDREQRVYSDEEVLRLPACPPSHPHYAEWQLREQSMKKLLEYLSAKKEALDILEIGCGNGWLAHRLAAIPCSNITGMDINFTELQQAARVFNDCRKLRFIYGDIGSGILEDRRYNIILFAASIQYFRCINELLSLAMSHLHPGGEIHIIDTHLYRSSREAAAARERTRKYYANMGMNAMNAHYFHHTIDSFRSFCYEARYDPYAWKNRLRRKSHPFHWVIIRKNAHA